MKVWVLSNRFIEFGYLSKNKEIDLSVVKEKNNESLEVEDELFICGAYDKAKNSFGILARAKVISILKNKKSVKIKILETDLEQKIKIRDFNEKKYLYDLISSNLENKLLYLLSENDGSYLRRFWYAHYNISKEELNTRFSLVDSIEDIDKNMNRFDTDIQKYDQLRKSLSRFQKWYYIHENNLIAPSKFIGYKDMNGILFGDKDAITQTDGGDTEHRLSRWFIPYENINLENYIREYFGTSLRKTFKMKVLESEIKIIEKEFGKAANSINLPLLKPNNRDREFKKYSDELKGQVLYEHLINSKTHRWLDKNILRITSGNTKGRNSANILYYLGMKAEYRGIFKGKSINEVINILENDDQDYSVSIKLLKLSKDEELSKVIDLDIEAEKVEEGYGIEGSSREYYGKRYERNARNRMLAIQEHGLSCKVCNFNFEMMYGEHGKDFIEIHHIKPLSTLSKAIKVNPKTDLVPLCSNCHRMIHRRKNEVLTIEELSKKLKMNKS
ncbi:HNH endonuclease [Exiguobacterium sp. s193]|uniref:HNH endonuclease n=1 Tax=Exiguobacterium sp. s193 TaxID=2751207 RepID=UPI001BEB7D9A